MSSGNRYPIAPGPLAATVAERAPQMSGFQKRGSYPSGREQVRTVRCGPAAWRHHICIICVRAAGSSNATARGGSGAPTLPADLTPPDKATRPASIAGGDLPLTRVSRSAGGHVLPSPRSRCGGSSASEAHTRSRTHAQVARACARTQAAQPAGNPSRRRRRRGGGGDAWSYSERNVCGSFDKRRVANKASVSCPLPCPLCRLFASAAAPPLGRPQASFSRLHSCLGCSITAPPPPAQRSTHQRRLERRHGPRGITA
eukprot:353222-Chlamydomonas_euryale.AAC.2